MKSKSDAFADLVEALKVLPNVGPKTAQRMAFDLLQHHRTGAQRIVNTLQTALEQVQHCRLCNTLCEGDLCSICSDKTRDVSRLMIVQMPVDVFSMENAHCHDGLYFVLAGQIQPTQNQDLQSIALEQLLARITEHAIQEVIIATDFTAEGNATAFILFELLKKFSIKISRLSQGMPLGSELEYIDAGTLAQAVYERKSMQ